MADGPRHNSATSPAPDLSLAIPCYNEEDSVGSTARELVKAFSDRGYRLELVLVDNGSTDRTGEVIHGLAQDGLPVVSERVAVNQGYGYGVLRGLQRCSGGYVGFICADAQVDAHDVVKLFDVAAKSRTPKLLKVRRRFRMDGLQRKIVSVTYNMIANFVFGGLGSIDVNGNPKIFPREYLERMGLESRDWFLDAEVLIRAKQLGLGVFEMNVLAQMRAEGGSHVRASTCWEFVKNLLRYRFSGGAPDSRAASSRALSEHSAEERR